MQPNPVETDSLYQLQRPKGTGFRIRTYSKGSPQVASNCVSSHRPAILADAAFIQKVTQNKQTQTKRHAASN